MTDSQARTATVRYQVIYRVPPTPPTADADPTDPPERNYHILLGQGVTFDPRQSFDPDTRDFGDYIRTYRWDINANVNNPVFDRTINDANGQQQNVLLNLTANELAALGVNAAGQYTMLLEVEDTTALTQPRHGDADRLRPQPGRRRHGQPQPRGLRRARHPRRAARPTTRTRTSTSWRGPGTSTATASTTTPRARRRAAVRPASRSTPAPASACG